MTMFSFALAKKVMFLRAAVQDRQEKQPAETRDRTGDLLPTELSRLGFNSAHATQHSIVKQSEESDFACGVCDILSKHFQQALAGIHVNVLRIFSLLPICVGPLTAHTQRSNFCEFSGERKNVRQFAYPDQGGLLFLLSFLPQKISNVIH